MKSEVAGRATISSRPIELLVAMLLMTQAYKQEGYDMIVLQHTFRFFTYYIYYKEKPLRSYIAVLSYRQMQHLLSTFLFIIGIDTGIDSRSLHLNA